MARIVNSHLQFVSDHRRFYLYFTDKSFYVPQTGFVEVELKVMSQLSLKLRWNILLRTTAPHVVLHHVRSYIVSTRLEPVHVQLVGVAERSNVTANRKVTVVDYVSLETSPTPSVNSSVSRCNRTETLPTCGLVHSPQGNQETKILQQL